MPGEVYINGAWRLADDVKEVYLNSGWIVANKGIEIYINGSWYVWKSGAGFTSILVEDIGLQTARVTFAVNAYTNSVQVRSRINGGAWGGYTMQNTTPSTGGYTQLAGGSPVTNPGDFIEFELTPWTGSNATGTAGAPVIDGIVVA